MAIVMQPLPLGVTVAGRFFLEAICGRGGTGVVYRAEDRAERQTVALKVLDRSEQGVDLQRFDREAELLAELRHPGIVRHIAHGVEPDGRPYLAMEWIEGQDLAARLRLGAPSVDQSVALIRAIAEILSVAHRRGVVHRDIKPSNIFLRHGALDRPVLLDFGLARLVAAGNGITRTGAILGTPGYMSPEQAGGDASVGATADIFALGCVLFECLTGRPPFAAEHYHAALAKVLFGDAPRVRHLRPDLPERVDELVHRMLARDRRARPGDADALVSELSSIASTAVGGAGAPPIIPAAGMITVVAAVDPPPQEDPDPHGGEERDERLRALVAALSCQQARTALLSSSSLVATVTLDGAATDQAARGARCALLIKGVWPRASIAIATGRDSDAVQIPRGATVDAAWNLLRRAQEQQAETILLDSTTGGLLDGRFDVAPLDAGSVALLGERANLDPTRLLIGKPTPCVGREFELNTLEGMLAACRDQSTPCAALVVAPPGTGKSRVRHELVRRVRARQEDVVVLVGRAEPERDGTPYGVLADALRRLCAISTAEPPATQRERLRKRVGAVLSDREAQHVSEFLGEMCGVPFDDETSPKLRAARQDRRLMVDHIHDAVSTLFAAECRTRPVVLVLEDLHWADAPTIRLIDVVLGNLATCPLAVLAFARPEIGERFPRLWAGRGCHVIRLGGLSRRACEQLIHHVLGPHVSARATNRIIEQSLQNALFLEEMIRAVAAGDEAPTAPATVIAMVQARFKRLGDAARGVLGQASVLGQVFTRRGVLSLSGHARDAGSLDDALDELAQAEVVERHTGGADGDVEYAMRHVLFRDAAYAMLGEDERRRAHERAACYLEAAGDPSPLAIAEHHRAAGALEPAGTFYALAADQALARNDLDGALKCSELGLVCGADGALRATLLAGRAQAHLWRAEFQPAVTCGTEALPLLEPNTRRWCQCLSAVAFSHVELGDLERFSSHARLLLAATPAPDARMGYIEALSLIGILFNYVADRRMDAETYARLQVACEDAPIEDVAHGWLTFVAADRGFLLGADPWATLAAAQESRDHFEAAGDRRMAAAARAICGAMELELFGLATAEATLRTGLATLESLEEKRMIAFTEMILVTALAWEGPDESLEESRCIALRILERAPGTVYAGFGECALAHVHLRTRDLDRSEDHARRALELLRSGRAVISAAFVALIAVLLARHKIADARDVAREASTLLPPGETWGPSEPRLRLAVAKAHLAADEADDARRTILEGLTALRARADRIPDPAVRSHYLHAVRAHARIHELAIALGLDAHGTVSTMSTSRDRGGSAR